MSLRHTHTHTHDKFLQVVLTFSTLQMAAEIWIDYEIKFNYPVSDFLSSTESKTVEQNALLSPLSP